MISDRRILKLTGTGWWFCFEVDVVWAWSQGDLVGLTLAPAGPSIPSRRAASGWRLPSYGFCCLKACDQDPIGDPVGGPGEAGVVGLLGVHVPAALGGSMTTGRPLFYGTFCLER